MQTPDAAPAYESFIDAMNQAQRMIEAASLVVAAHPEDVTDEMRERIEQTPLTTLQESTMVPKGKVYLIRPGALTPDGWNV